MKPAPGSALAFPPETSLQPLEVEVLRTLLYYHIFSFPLNCEEIKRQIERTVTNTEEMVGVLAGLEKRGLIGRDGDLYHLDEPESAALRRESEARAHAVMPRARSRSAFIARLPYVRAVAISGTMSKGVMKAEDDLDFMVFTEPGRVWICRALMMAFKKIFLFNSHRSFCVNYLLAVDSLEIPERDLFTASEIAWLLPTVNGDLYDEFIATNQWILDVFPNWRHRSVDAVTELPRSGLKSIAEAVIDRIGGDRLDRWCRRFIARRNRRRYRHLDDEVFEIALRTEANASKHHPRAFRHHTLSRYQQAVRKFEARYGVVLG